MPVCHACGYDSPLAFRFCPECGAPATQSPEPREQRKVVTVVFCDVTGSTALGESLDPEALRGLLARYFERMRGIVERHSGTVEKFIGDAVMAVFGIPTLHEDDALRACRAACEMRDALPELGVGGRIGVATGEVVTGTSERLATGDAVNVAARLEQAAAPGEVLIADATYQLARDHLDAVAVEPLAMKGKATPVSAWRLVSVGQAAPRRQLGTPMVGRERQRHALAHVFAAAQDDRACHLVTLLGVAGVGKSRLVHELLRDLDATVVRGRCLSYGEGITYWPVIELLGQLEERPDDETAARVIAGLFGEADETGSHARSATPATAVEVAWAFRKTLEAAAKRRPLVCVFDDIHWAEPALLDLIEHVADLSRDAPILLICMARPELLDHRAGWGGGKLNAQTMLLEPLSAQETDQLIDLLGGIPDTLRERIRAAAEGNPLFVEEMLAMLRERGQADGEVIIPPSIHALLAARLDQLEPLERAVLERGSVEGQVFHRGAVTALARQSGGDALHSGDDVNGQLLGLVRKDLIRPDQPTFAGDDAFRFRHLLIRDAAYDALPKAVRAELHERFADWLTDHAQELIDVDEILGYHLEQAVRYRAELSLPERPDLNQAARERLADAGQRARLRGDLPAAINLVSRAADLYLEGELDLALELNRIETTFYLAQVEDASALARELSQRAAATGDRVAELCGQIEQAVIRLSINPEGSADELTRLVEQALPELEEAGNHLALFLAYYALGEAQNVAGLADQRLKLYATAYEHAERSGVPGLAEQIVPEIGGSQLFGSTSTDDLLRWTDEMERRGIRHQSLSVNRAVCLAMRRDTEQARSIMASVRREMLERGMLLPFGFVFSQLAPMIEVLAGDPASAVALGEEGCRILEQAGERGVLSTSLCLLAQNLYTLGRLDEAEAAAARGRELGSSDDLMTQATYRTVIAKISASRGRMEHAESLAREAVVLAETMDDLDGQGHALATLGEVLVKVGKLSEAADAYGTAIDRFQRKGNLVMAAWTAEALEPLAPTAP